ncbi:hypothetical protein P4639_22315 [Priestia megaterium]|uniref:hypothetical protein n=1 Tax=Priestia megaterium TaxID=1404 RepID=UPI002E21CE07|nr:hypothetical protein [Priestia megaterium]
MNLSVASKEEYKIQVGDIIEYEQSSHRSHPYYMVCRSEEEGYFVMSLTGTKGKLRYYKSLMLLQHRLRGVSKIYSKDEWQLKLAQKL